MTNTSYELATSFGLHVIYVVFVTSYFNYTDDVVGEFMSKSA